MSRRAHKGSTKPKLASSAVDDEELPPTGPLHSVCATISFFVPFAALLPCLPKTILGGDSGDIVVSAHQFSVPHPPGYPLIMVLGHAWMSVFPVGEPAWRLAVLNAFFAALASLGVYGTTSQLTKTPLLSLGTAMVFAFSPLIWCYSITAEVFAMNNAFAAAAPYAVLVATRTNTSAGPRLCSFLAGLALANQHTMLLFEIPFAVFLLSRTMRLPDAPRQVLILVACFAVGLLMPYTALPISTVLLSGHHSELLSWGNQASVSGFMRHLLRQEYGTFDLISNMQGPGFFANVGFYAKTLAAETAGIAPYLVLGGIAVVVNSNLSANRPSRYARTCLAIVVAYCGYLAFFLWRSNLPLDVPVYRGVVKRFFLQAHTIALPLAALGGSSLSRRFGWSSTPISVAMFAALTAQVWTNRGALDQSANDSVRSYAQALLHPLPQNAILLTKGDLTIYPTRYVQTCLELRPDVAVLDQEIMGYPWFTPRARAAFRDIVFPPGQRLRPRGANTYNLKQFFDANQNKRPVFIIDAKEGDTSYVNDYEFVPMGYVHAVVPKGSILAQAATAQGWAEYSSTLLKEANVSLLPATVFDEESWEGLVRAEYYATKHRHALYCMNMALVQQTTAAQKEWLLLSESMFDEIVHENEEHAYQPLWSVYKNAAIASEKLWRDHHVKKSRRKCLDAFRGYLSTARGADAEYSKAVKYVAELQDLP